MDGRKWLNKDDTLTLCEYGDKQKVPREFTILSRLGKDQSDEDSKGSSSICYKARSYNGDKGVLKEFYPVDAYNLSRNADGQLVSDRELEDAHEKYKLARKEYLDSQKELLSKRQSGEHDDLASFIPRFEIYQGCDVNGKVVGTAYIWTPEPDYESFEKLCTEIRQHPEEEPEHKLVIALRVIKNLAESICALHMAGFLHRDIKPENFGYNRFHGNVKPEDVQLFDVDSVCFATVRPNYNVFSRGYTEPEAEQRKYATNQTDIYSIGATLFHAIIVPDQPLNEDNIYLPEYFDRIRFLVNDSRLIRASEVNSHPRVRGILIRILEKCLSPRKDRYKKCEDLIADLEEAICLILPSDLEKQYRENGKWSWPTVSEELDQNSNKNSTLSILYHLYRNPLYTYVNPEDTSTNILILGFGQYGPKFLDACLQAGQSQKQNLNITVVSDNYTDRELYLSDRPELNRFFNIDGSLPEDNEAYGTVNFKKRTLDPENARATRRMLKGIFDQYFSGTAPHYVFIALGKDTLNACVAEEICRYIGEYSASRCVVSFAAENFLPVTNQPDMIPVLVDADMKDMPLYQEIERMAFNTHLLWEKNLNKDFEEIRSRFQEKYNHDSCVSCVLSLKYKLHSLGIDLEDDPEDSDNIGQTIELAAEMFSQKALTEENRDALNELIWMEHRRWVTDRLCQGWTLIDDLSECPSGSTRDNDSKKHVCLVRSEPNQNLSEEFTSFKKWDEATEADLARLDELDQLSVRLHQEMKRRAENVSPDLFNGEHIEAIQNLIRGRGKTEAAFQEWYTCARDLWHEALGSAKRNRENSEAELYDILLDAFVDQVPENMKAEVQQHVDAFDTEFRPIKACTEYRNLKQEDTAIIVNIPYILTFSEHICMVIPYGTGNNSEAFGNVAAPTVVNPDKIVYLYMIDQEEDLNSLIKSLPGTKDYLSRKNVRSTIQFVIAYTKELSEVEKILEHKAGRSTRFIPIISSDMSAGTLVEALTKYVEKEQSGKIVVLEKNDTPLSWMLLGAGFYDGYASYRFLNRDMKFTSLSRCDMLDYYLTMLDSTQKLPYITVDNIMAFNKSLRKEDDQPELFHEYKGLWKKYTRNRQAWKSLCHILGACNNDIKVCFDGDTFVNENDKMTFKFEVRSEHLNRARKILNALKSDRCTMVEKGSSIQPGKAKDYQIVFVGASAFKRKYDVLFKKIVPLRTGLEDITCDMDKQEHSVNIRCEDLTVSNAVIRSSSAKNSVIQLLQWLNREHYIYGLKVTQNGEVSFTYASSQVKKVLTTRGKMLEVYTYHKARELGWFDDIESGYKVIWDDSDEEDDAEAMSEFDCILTKGFRSLFVECKARPTISQDFYFKLDSLTRRFGINATAVLIAETDSGEDINLANSIQKKRGNMLDVITISEKSEISDVGQILRRIMNGTYQQNKADMTQD